MKATSIKSSDTRIVPADQNKAMEVTKNSDVSMAVKFNNGTTGTIDDKDLQAFVVWTMLNPECTK